MQVALKSMPLDETKFLLKAVYVTTRKLLHLGVMRNREIIIESTFLGIVIAIALILLLNFTSSKEQIVKTGKHSTAIALKKDVPVRNAPTEEVRSARAIGSIPSVVVIEVDRQILCLFTILYEVDVAFVQYETNVPLPLIKFYFTLFRTFISPNAP